MSFRRSLLALAIALSPRLAVGSNFHEHISTIPSYDDYVFAFGQTGAPLVAQPMSRLSKGVGPTISDVFGRETAIAVAAKLGIRASENDLLAALSERLSTLSFAEVTALVSESLRSAGELRATPELVQRSFFEFTEINRRGDNAYLSIGWDIRIIAQDTLRQGEGVFRLFENMLRRVPIEERRVMTITANGFRDFMSERNARIMARLRRIIESSGTHLEWMAGFVRKHFETLDDGAFEQNLKDFDALLAADTVRGIDITGSIVEHARSHFDITDAAESRFGDRLKRMMELVARYPKAHLKLHIYESTREGDFYRLFYGALDAIGAAGGRFPSLIRIGHINVIGDVDIARFVSLRERFGIQFAFEANIDSNIAVKGAKIEDLAATINKLVQAGFDVRLGTDGMGIIGELSHLSSSLKRLSDAGLSTAAQTQILDGSLEPLKVRLQTGAHPRTCAGNF